MKMPSDEVVAQLFMLSILAFLGAVAIAISFVPQIAAHPAIKRLFNP